MVTGNQLITINIQFSSVQLPSHVQLFKLGQQKWYEALVAYAKDNEIPQ